MINRLLKIPLLVWHRFLSPCLPPCCRFYPSCAQYALDALDRHPWHRALGLILWRLARCHPFHPGGYDPVPDPVRPRERGRVDPDQAGRAIPAAGLGAVPLGHFHGAGRKRSGS